MTRGRIWRQAVKSWLKRRVGIPQPTGADIAAARARLAAGPPASPADPLLARGYCCESGCAHCPWRRRRP